MKNLKDTISKLTAPKHEISVKATDIVDSCIIFNIISQATLYDKELDKRIPLIQDKTIRKKLEKRSKLFQEAYNR
jgi:hypothetical protein